MKPNFKSRTAKIIAEIRTRACIDDVDAEVIKDILKDELNEYYDELKEYYDALHECYDDGYDDGYAAGKSAV